MNTNLMIFLILVGIACTFPWGVGTWMRWQGMKKGTFIPAGAFTSIHAKTVNFILKVVSIVVIVFFGISKTNIPAWPFPLLVSILTMWFAGVWSVTILERKLYGTELEMDIIVYAAENYAKDIGPEQAAQLMSVVVPNWWLRLMPSHWQNQLQKRLSSILSSN